MNDKIKELAKCSGFYIPQEPFLGNEGESLDRINEFARLIIYECLDIIKTVEDNYTKLRKSTIDFEDKNILAEGEVSADRIRKKIIKRFRDKR